MVLFEIYGFGDTSLTSTLYIVQAVWCILVLLPFLFILRCWQRFVWTRNTRTFFTLYLSGIDSASRIVFLHYYILRLVMIYRDGSWLDDDRGFIRLACNGTANSTVGDDSTTAMILGDPCAGENLISRQNCLVFSLFLYWASAWPMSSILLLQLHALVGTIIPERYEKLATLRFAFATMCLAFAIDTAVGIASYEELRRGYVDGDSPEIVDACKFEYFSRLSIVNSTYVFVLLCAIGSIALVQVIVGIINGRKGRQFVNAAANSPLHGWSRMSTKERTLTVSIMTCAIASFILFLIHFIVYLLQGNSLLRQILNITISVFSFIGPIELMWFNIDIRRAVFVLIFGDEDESKVSPSKKSVVDSFSSSSSAKNSTEVSSICSGIDENSDPPAAIAKYA